MTRCWLLALLAVVFSTLPGAAEPRLESGSAFLSESLRARQADDGANPGMLWVEAGASLWEQTAGEAGKACADCHGDATESMRGVFARYPAIDPASGDLLNLEARINRCRTRNQRADPLEYETDELLGLTSFIGYQSRGLPMDVDVTGPAATRFAAGEVFFHRRQGQLNIACAQCHEHYVGGRLRGDSISHGLGNGFPAYRLEWQAMGSLHRRLRACSLGVRAIQFAPGSPEYLDLELYLAWRARGVPVETPAIRR